MLTHTYAIESSTPFLITCPESKILMSESQFPPILRSGLLGARHNDGQLTSLKHSFESGGEKAASPLVLLCAPQLV